MAKKKTKYPYYATWWFFVGIIVLTWLTPITSNWELYFFGEEVIGKLVNVRNDEGRIVRKYAFIHKGYPCFSEYEDNRHSVTLPLIVKMYIEKDDPNTNFIAGLSFMYFGKRLIFPVLFQMLMVAFYFLVRTKEYRN